MLDEGIRGHMSYAEGTAKDQGKERKTQTGRNKVREGKTNTKNHNVELTCSHQNNRKESE